MKPIRVYAAEHEYQIDVVESYNSFLGQFKVLTDTDYFKLGQGYWIHSKVIKIWQVPL
jgi:hypothetical protein